MEKEDWERERCSRNREVTEGTAARPISSATRRRSLLLFRLNSLLIEVLRGRAFARAASSTFAANRRRA